MRDRVDAAHGQRRLGGLASFGQVELDVDREELERVAEDRLGVGKRASPSGTSETMRASTQRRDASPANRCRWPAASRRTTEVAIAGVSAKTAGSTGTISSSPVTSSISGCCRASIARSTSTRKRAWLAGQGHRLERRAVRRPAARSSSSSGVVGEIGSQDDHGRGRRRIEPDDLAAACRCAAIGTGSRSIGVRRRQAGDARRRRGPAPSPAARRPAGRVRRARRRPPGRSPDRAAMPDQVHVYVMANTPIAMASISSNAARV